MKIFVLSQEYPPNTLGGFGTHIVELLDGLARSGIEVVAFTHTFGHAHSSVMGSVTIHRIGLAASRSSGYEFTLDDIRTLNQLVFSAAKCEAEKTGKPDVIHIHDPNSIDAALRLKREFSAQLISSVHLLYKPFLQWWSQQVPESILKWERELCVSADFVITVSRAMAELIVDTYEIKHSRITVIHNSFSMDGLDHGGSSHRIGRLLRERYAPGTTSIIAFAGRLVPMKGVLQLLQSASEVVRACPDVAYLIAGRPTMDTYSREIMHLLEEKPELKSRVHFVGWLDRRQIGGLYTAAILAAVPSVYEPFGYSALEAMACGVPVIGTCTGGLAEVIESVGGGLVVPLIVKSSGRREASPQDLAAAQIELLENPARRSTLARAGRERALLTYPLDEMIGQTVQVYQRATRVTGEANALTG
jgi:glycosyltransferase involved in cell wall biosynthesis